MNDRSISLLLQCVLLVSALTPAAVTGQEAGESPATYEVFATVSDPWALAFPPAGSAYGSELYVSSGPSDLGSTGIDDEILTISETGVVTPFATLLPEADPVGLQFAPAGSPFGDMLFVTANNRDDGRSGDCGGTIQTVDTSGVWADFTSLTSPYTNCPGGLQTALGEPGGIAFGGGGDFGSDIFITNNSDYPSDVVRVDPLANTSPFVDDGQIRAGLVAYDSAFGPGGAFGTDLYFTNSYFYPGSFNAILVADDQGDYGSPFATLPDPPVTMEFSTGGAWGTYIWVAVNGAGGSWILRVSSDGTIHTFATAFVWIAGVDSLEFSPDGSYLYVADHGADAVYRLLPPVLLDGFESGDTSAWTYTVP